jgi:hypothetical protein
MEFSEEGRRARFEQSEKIGLDRIKADLEEGGRRVVGGLRCKTLPGSGFG